MSGIEANRRKWNRRYAEACSDSFLPTPHPLGEQWGHRFIGGRALDAASGLGRGIATAGSAFAPIYAVDISDTAVTRARAIWSDAPQIRWIVAEVARLAWPDDFFGLVCAFGFTELPFFADVRAMIGPGGMFLYEGFSARQREVKPELDPAWTATAAAMRDLFAGWEELTCEEPPGPPFRLRYAAIRPDGNTGIKP